MSDTDYWVTSDGTEMHADLPLHFPIGVNARGEGPCDPPHPEHDHFECWCGYRKCARWNRETGEPQ